MKKRRKHIEYLVTARLRNFPIDDINAFYGVGEIIHEFESHHYREANEHFRVMRGCCRLTPGIQDAAYSKLCETNQIISVDLLRYNKSKDEWHKYDTFDCYSSSPTQGDLQIVKVFGKDMYAMHCVKLESLNFKRK